MNLRHIKAFGNFEVFLPFLNVNAKFDNFLTDIVRSPTSSGKIVMHALDNRSNRCLLRDWWSHYLVLPPGGRWRSDRHIDLGVTKEVRGLLLFEVKGLEDPLTKH